MEPIIKVDNVSMCFNLSTEKHESLKEYLLAMVQGRLQYDEFYALKDVSLDIMPGDFYGLVGLNGSGKSTLLKTIAGVYKPSKGKVTVNGTIAPLIELGAGFDMDLTARVLRTIELLCICHQPPIQDRYRQSYHWLAYL